MKLKSYCVVLLVMMTALVSCSKDEDTVDVAKIVGTWNLESEVLSLKVSGSPYGHTYQGTADDYLKILADGTMTLAMDDEERNGTYSISGKQLICKLDSRDLTFTVTTLTETQLVLYLKTTQDANNYTEETLTFKR